jgi:hypothetical protein
LLEAAPAPRWEATVVDAHRDLIATRVLNEFQAAPGWVRELYLVLAARLGSAPLIPMLVEVARQNQHGQAELAVTALAAITGWDARFDAQHSPRPSADVAEDYERECAP